MELDLAIAVPLTLASSAAKPLREVRLHLVVLAPPDHLGRHPQAGQERSHRLGEDGVQRPQVTGEQSWPVRPRPRLDEVLDEGRRTLLVSEQRPQRRAQCGGEQLRRQLPDERPADLHGADERHRPAVVADAVHDPPDQRHARRSSRRGSGPRRHPDRVPPPRRGPDPVCPAAPGSPMPGTPGRPADRPRPRSPFSEQIHRERSGAMAHRRQHVRPEAVIGGDAVREEDGGPGVPRRPDVHPTSVHVHQLGCPGGRVHAVHLPGWPCAIHGRTCIPVLPVTWSRQEASGLSGMPQACGEGRAASRPTWRRQPMPAPGTSTGATSIRPARGPPSAQLGAVQTNSVRPSSPPSAQA